MPSSPAEVRVHPGAPRRIPFDQHVRVLKVHRSGYYAWLQHPLSARAMANETLTLKIREFYDQSMGIYGSPRIFCDLREAGLTCGENRVARLMKVAQIKSVRGYKRPRFKVGRPALVAPNQLQRQFQHDEPDQAWVTDITYIRTHEGWLYLAATSSTAGARTTA